MTDDEKREAKERLSQLREERDRLKAEAAGIQLEIEELEALLDWENCI